ncbi:MAG: hypothetical protein HZA92_19610 [Verrucomicrobia bacterium]|nr:hypothetical protein [Verrucomicrobiota bacterium]
MDWQQLAALAIVGIAAFLLLRSQLRPRGHCLSKAGPCGCSATGPAPKGSIVFRARKGERPQVIVKLGVGHAFSEDNTTSNTPPLWSRK